MKLIPSDRQIYISARLWHEIDPKVRLAPFIYALHDGIDLSKYGDGLKKFFFTFLILKPDNKRFLPGTYFEYYIKASSGMGSIRLKKPESAKNQRKFGRQNNKPQPKEL